MFAGFTDKFVEQAVLNQTVEEPYACLFHLRLNQEADSDANQFPNVATYYDPANKRCVFGWVPLEDLKDMGIEERNQTDRRVMIDPRCEVSGGLIKFSPLICMRKGQR